MFKLSFGNENRAIKWGSLREKHNPVVFPPNYYSWSNMKKGLNNKYQKENYKQGISKSKYVGRDLN